MTTEKDQALVTLTSQIQLETMNSEPKLISFNLKTYKLEHVLAYSVYPQLVFLDIFRTFLQKVQIFICQNFKSFSQKGRSKWKSYNWSSRGFHLCKQIWKNRVFFLYKSGIYIYRYSQKLYIVRKFLQGIKKR